MCFPSTIITSLYVVLASPNSSLIIVIMLFPLLCSIQAFFKWFERRIKANLQATRHLNKEALIDEILELVIFTKRAEAAKFINTMQVLADDSLSMSHFVTALGGVVHSEDVRTLKAFAHSIIRSEKRYEKKVNQQNQLAAAAMRRKQLETNSNHVAIKQTKNESKFNTVKQHLKGRGVFYLCSGPGTGPGIGVFGTGAGGGAGADKDGKAHTQTGNVRSKDGQLVSQESGLSETSTTAATTASTTQEKEKSKLAIMSALSRVASLQDVDVDALPEEVTKVDTSGPDDVALDILPASPLLSPKSFKKSGSTSSFSPRTLHSPGTPSSNVSLTESPQKTISTSPIKKLFHCKTHSDDMSIVSANNSPLSRSPPHTSLDREESLSASSSSLLSLKQGSQLPGVGQMASRAPGAKTKSRMRRQSSNV